MTSKVEINEIPNEIQYHTIKIRPKKTNKKNIVVEENIAQLRGVRINECKKEISRIIKLQEKLKYDIEIIQKEISDINEGNQDNLLIHLYR